MPLIEQKPLKWRHALICGVLWGVVVVASVTLSQPINGLTLPELLTWLRLLLFDWCCAGLVLSLGCKFAEDLKHPVALMPVVFAIADIVEVAVTYLIRANQAPGNFGHLMLQLPIFDLTAYNSWVVVFYGGLYGLAYASTRTALRLRLRLSELRLTRNEAEAKLRETRLQAVRGQIQPAMLLDALEALSQAYRRDQRAGDQMFDLLIAFLRAAMPGLRSGTSTLTAELAVINHYDALRTALEVGPPIWRLALMAPPVDLPFPPLRLLPALDRLSRAAPPGSLLEVEAQNEGASFLVQVGARSTPPLAPALMTRLRAAMRRDLGVGAMMTTTLAGSLVAELRIPISETSYAPGPTTIF